MAELSPDLIQELLKEPDKPIQDAQDPRSPYHQYLRKPGKFVRALESPGKCQSRRCGCTAWLTVQGMTLCNHHAFIRLDTIANELAHDLPVSEIPQYIDRRQVAGTVGNPKFPQEAING